MPRFRLSLVLAALMLSSSLCSLPAIAQNDDTENESDAPSNGSAARLQVRINELEEQVRRLQGALEQVNFSNRQLKGQMDKMKGDIDYRLQALEKNGPSPAAAGAPATLAPQSSSIETNAPETPNAKYTPSIQAPQTLESKQPAAVPTFPSSHEHYSAAFKLMSNAKYSEASNMFSAFTERYPKDPLIGHAYYWLGKTNYILKDYVKAADNFRQGYEAMPAGPRASDNLIELALALSATGKDKDSCVVLKKVAAKFGKTSSSVRSRVDEEMNRLDCR